MAKKYKISQLIAENIIPDKMEWIPTDRTRFFMMLLASVSNSVAVDERGMSFMRCTYRSSIDKTENTQYQDIFDVTEDDTYVYLRYIEEVWVNDERTEREKKFTWRIELEDAEKAVKTLELLDFYNPYDRFLRFKSSCGLNDFYEYL